MSATSEANSLEAFFAIGIQGAKGTAATTLYKGLATVSALEPIVTYRDNRQEHPAAASAWARAGYQTITGYLAGARVTFALRPKMIVPVLMAAGYQVSTTDNSTYYTHALTQGTNAQHKWATIAWSVPDSDGAFVLRGVDMRATSVSIEASTDEIMVTAEFRGLTVEPMSGSPTYVSEQTDEILPWLGTRTNINMGISGSQYSMIERIRGITFAITNTLREDDRALWEATRSTLARESHDAVWSLTDMNMSDSVLEALVFGSNGGTSVSTAVRTGDINVEWESADDISGASTPYRFEVDTPTCQVIYDEGSIEANGSDIMTISATANVIGTGTPVTINIDNNVASY